MTKEFSKKVKSEVRPALFGTDFHGQECWFCFRRIVGCPGILAEISDKKIHKHYVLWLPESYSQKNDIFRKQTRARFRDPNIVSYEAFLYSEKQKVEARQDEWMQEDLKNIEESTQQLAKWKEEERRGKSFCTSNRLPALIECPSCRLINRVAELRGPIAVKGGSVLK
jgi:hypothetical protein